MESVSRRTVLGIGATALVAAGSGAMSFLADATPVSAQTATTTTTTTTATSTAGQRGRRGPGFGGILPGSDLQAVATALNLPLAQLRQQQAGKSIAQIAQAQNVPLQAVKNAIVAAAKTRLDAAVTAGRLTSAQETLQLTNLQARLDQFLNSTAPSRFPRGGRHPTANHMLRGAPAQS